MRVELSYVNKNSVFVWIPSFQGNEWVNAYFVIHVFHVQLELSSHYVYMMWEENSPTVIYDIAKKYAVCTPY